MNQADKDLLKWYRKGFYDELDGTSSNPSAIELENYAYRLGVINAIVGDDVSSVDYLSDVAILALIKDKD